MTLSNLKAEIMKEFDEKFGQDGGYLCQYNPNMGTFTSNSETVKSFISSTIDKIAREAIEEVRLEKAILTTKDDLSVGFGRGWNYGFEIGWNQAISESQTKADEFLGKERK